MVKQRLNRAEIEGVPTAEDKVGGSRLHELVSQLATGFAAPDRRPLDLPWIAADFRAPLVQDGVLPCELLRGGMKVFHMSAY